MSNAVAYVLPPHEGRLQPRTHLFVAATLYADSASTPVHIRNMSAIGAMVEAVALPEVGCRIALKRGPLHATGHIAWRVERRAGIKLDALVSVPDWMARLGNAGQDRVDALVAAIRNNGPSAGALAVVVDTGSASIEGELAALRAELGELGSSLIADVIVAASHPEIQTIDIAIQRIDRIAASLRGGG